VGDQGESDGQPVPPVGMWGISTKGLMPASTPLDAQIRSLLEWVTGDSEIWASLSHDYKCRVFVGWFLHSANENGGVGDRRVRRADRAPSLTRIRCLRGPAIRDTSGRAQCIGMDSVAQLRISGQEERLLT